MTRTPDKSFLRNYYLAATWYDFIFAYAVYNALFSLRGLSILEISLLLSWWATISLILEIPSGALADRWNRPRMLTIAPLLKAVCFIIWFLAGGNFLLFALGFAFWALGSSFVSGTTESLLYDTLKSQNRTDDYERILGRKTFLHHLALAVSILFGGLIAEYQVDWAIVLSVIPLLLSSFFASRLKEAPRTEAQESVDYFGYLRIAWREVRSSRVLAYLFAYSVGVSILSDLEEFDQLYYQFVDLPWYGFGIAGFIWSLTNAISCWYAHRLKDRDWCYYVLPALSAGLLFLAGGLPSIPMIGALFAAYCVAAPLQVLVAGRIQHSIRSISRATVTSAHAFLCNLFGVAVLAAFGVIGRLWDLPAIFLVTACFLLAVALAAWAFRRNTRAQPH